MPGRLVHIPLWWVIVGVGTCFLTPILSIAVSVMIATNNQRQNEDRRASLAAAVESENRQRVCDLIVAQIAAFEEVPPATSTGKNVVEAWHGLYVAQKCQPPK
jgi:hypothetical protein